VASQDIEQHGEAASPRRPAARVACMTQGARKPRKSRRAFWLKQLHSWHWISAAVSLSGMLLFAVTGLTLNHAASIGATPVVTRSDATLPPPLLRRLAGEHPAAASVPADVARAGAAAVGVDPGGHAGEWSDEEVYVALPGPGTDAWVSINRRNGHISAERTWRGWVSYLNDLHKGRNTGDAWFWFIDAFAVACILFTLTGLLLLQLHARHRPLTWPLVGLSLAVPLLLALFLIH
jgi:hypothetical protein